MVIRKRGFRLAFCVGVFLVRGCSVGIYPLGADSSLKPAVRAVSTLQLPLLSDLGPGLSQVVVVVEEGGGGGWRGRGRGRSGSGQAVRAVRSAISVPCREENRAQV